MAGGSTQRGRSVTSKVIAILSAFEHSRGSMSLTQIAEQADLPLSTAHRLGGELIEAGMLANGPHGKIQLGLKLWSIAQNTGRQLRDTARPFVQDMYSLTGHTSHLAIRDGASSLYIDRVYGPQRVPRASRVGASSIAVPVYHTGRLGCSIGIVVSSDVRAELPRHLPVLYGTSKRIEEATAHIPLETLLGAFIRDKPDEIE